MMPRKLDTISIIFIISQLFAIAQQCASSSSGDSNGVIQVQPRGVIYPDSTCQNSPKVCAPVRPDYNLIQGVGYYKFHTEAKKWPEARKTCVDEGAHLAILNSEEELQALLKIYQENDKSVKGIGKIKKLAWLGAHDQFNEGDWVTVLDQQLYDIPYQPWIKNHPKCGTQPDNTLNQDCGALSLKCGKMDDAQCYWKLPFICEMPYDCDLSGIDIRGGFEP